MAYADLFVAGSWGRPDDIREAFDEGGPSNYQREKTASKVKSRKILPLPIR
jgi:hypothetical protein